MIDSKTSLAPTGLAPWGFLLSHLINMKECVGTADRGKANRPVGAELRGSGPVPWRGMAPGSQKDLGFFSVPVLSPSLPSATTPSAIILCESAIDALSCFVLHPGCRCISTAGARPNPHWLADLIVTGIPVLCGFDADATGDARAGEMRARHPIIQRLRPSSHDWNDILRSAR